jgi:hypothetical protein
LVKKIVNCSGTGVVSSFTIAGIVTEGLDRAFMRLRSLLAIYWLPWLGASAAFLIVEILYADRWQLGSAPVWATNLVRAPFIAMAYVMLMRLLVLGQPPKRAINLDFSRETAWAVPLVAMWYLAAAALEKLPAQALLWLFPVEGHYGIEDWRAYSAFLVCASRIAIALLPLSVFGLIVLTASRGYPDWREHIRLLRLYPLRLIVIALLAHAAGDGLIIADSQFWKWAGAPMHAPLLNPWRLYIRDAALFRLSEFPLYFMLFVIETCLLAEAYRRILHAGKPHALSRQYPMTAG